MKTIKLLTYIFLVATFFTNTAQAVIPIQARRVVIRILNGKHQPVKGVRLRPKPSGVPSAPSDQNGRTWITVPSGSKRIPIEVVNASGQDWVLINALEDRIVVPSFEQKDENVVTISVVRRGDPEILLNGEILYASATRVIRRLGPTRIAQFLSPQQRYAVLAAEARRLGVKPADLEKAIHAWAQREGPYQKGVAALFEQKYHEATEYLSRSFDNQAGDLFNAAMNLGFSLYSEGHYTRAAEKYRVAVSLQPDNSSTNNDLGIVLLYLAQYDEAERRFDRALEIVRSEIEPDDYDIASLLLNKGWLLRVQNRFDEAEKAHHEALTIMTRKFGPKTFEMSRIYNAYGTLNQDRGNYVRAKEYYRKATQILGRDPKRRFDYIVELINLAGAEREDGELDAAIVHFETIFKGLARLVKDRVIDKEHPLIGNALNESGGVFNRLVRFDESEKRFNQARAIWEKTFGTSHPKVAIVLNNLASVYMQTNREGQAKPLFEQAVTIQQRSLGAEHPLVGRTFNNLALYFLSQRNFPEAERLFNLSLRLTENKPGYEHDVAGTFNNLGGLYTNIGRWNQAESYLKTALQMQRVWATKRPLEYSKSLVNLGDAYRRQKRYDEAEPLFIEALMVRDGMPGVSVRSMVEVLGPYGGLYYVQQKYEQALPFWKRALDLTDNKTGSIDYFLAQSLNNLGELYRVMGKHDQAEPLLKRAIQMWPALGLADSVNMMLSCEHYSDLLKHVGRGAEAENIAERAAQIRAKLQKR